jgi:hypothetical protein
MSGHCRGPVAQEEGLGNQAEQHVMRGGSVPGIPRTADQLKELTDEVVAWIPTVAGHLYLVNRRDPLSVLVEDLSARCLAGTRAGDLALEPPPS